MLTFFGELKNSTWNSNHRLKIKTLWRQFLTFSVSPQIEILLGTLFWRNLRFANTHFSKFPFWIWQFGSNLFYLSSFHNFFQSFWFFRNSWFFCGQKLSFIFLFWKTLAHLTLQRSAVKSEFSVRQWIHYSAVSFWP